MRFLLLPMELIDREEAEEKAEPLFSKEPDWDDAFPQTEKNIDDVHSDFHFPSEYAQLPSEERVLSPEGFYPLKIGMRVRHPKFGEGRVKAIEGTDEDQKATILFQTVGVKRLKVCQARLEIS